MQQESLWKVKKKEGFVGRQTSLVQNINGNDEKYAALGTIKVAGS
jgi:hypothetical protein